MGKYINPHDCTKEQFLHKYGKEVTILDIGHKEFDDWINENKYVVVWVDNGNFTTAAILYDKKEYDYFIRTMNNDERPSKYFIVNAEDLDVYLKEFEWKMKI
jgi:hypothetical protein